MLYYPQIKTNIARRQNQELQIRGLNRTNAYVSGELESCKNITSAKFPYIETCDNLEAVSTGVSSGYKPVSVYAWEKLFVVSNRPVTGGYACYYGGRYCGYVPTLTTPKQYAVVNTKLIVFPDKVYFNLNEDTDMESHALDTATLIQNITSGKATFTKAVKTKNSTTLEVTETPASLTITGATFPSVTVGATIILSGCINALNDMTLTVKSKSGNTLTFEEDWFAENEVTQDCSEYDISIYNGTNGVTIVPDLDYICSHGNRLWGVNSWRRTIYASALGDPTDFHTYEGLSTDAFAVGVGSAGDFTGCISLTSSILFLKQHCIHKMLGAFPAEYVLYEYEIEGPTEDNGLSVVNCNGEVMYISEHGIMTYAGTFPGVLIRSLGEGNMHNGIGAYDGNNYILYAEDDDGVPSLYVYDMLHDIWTVIDTGEVLGIAHLGDDTFVLVKGENTNTLYQLNSGEPLQGEWEMTFKPFIETVTGKNNTTQSIFEKKRYWHIYVRADFSPDSTLKAEIKTDDGRWRPVLRSPKLHGVKMFPIKTPRCDKLQLRLSGTGHMKILAMEREYSVGSAR